MNDALDLQLQALLAETERQPDEAFAQRVTQSVLAENRLYAARRRIWRRFASDAAASLVIVLAFLFLGSFQPPGPEGAELVPFSPSTVAVTLLALWFLVILKPGATARG